MGEFSEEGFGRKLMELRESQKEIEGLSRYCVHHRQHCRAVVKLWYKHIKSVPAARKLTTMYLANDVVQNSKKKGPEYGKEFGSVMKKVFEHLAQLEFDDKTIMSLVRLIGIWQERQIFDKKILHEISKIWDHKRRQSGDQASVSPKKRDSTGSSSAERRKSREVADINQEIDVEGMLDAPLEAASGSGRPEEETLTLSPRQGGSPGSGDPPEPEELIQALTDLENSASSDAVVREKIAKLPPEVSEVGKIDSLKSAAEAAALLGQVGDASALLDNYNGRLQEELKDRKKVGSMISEFLSAQRDLLAQAEERLELYLDKLEKIHQVKDELKSHIASLPDIPVLPATAGLAPLPSAGDLFTH